MISDCSAHSFHVHFLHDSIMQIYKGTRIFSRFILKYSPGFCHLGSNDNPYVNSFGLFYFQYAWIVIMFITITLRGDH